MAVAGEKAEQQLSEITECSICMSSFTDPRMLPCIYTFCLECLERTIGATQKQPLDKMPCPLCRQEFTIPSQGIIALQKNFFMENLLQFKTALRNNPPTLKIGTETEETIKGIISEEICTTHNQKPLDYYCVECKQVVCVSCFVESHRLHDCKEVATVKEEFRQIIKRATWKTTNYADEMMSMKKNLDTVKSDFLNKIEKEETAILKRNQELKDVIDKHTEYVLGDLYVTKSDYLEHIENLMELFDQCYTQMNSYKPYCSELIFESSASDICSYVDLVVATADVMEKSYEEIVVLPLLSVEVLFQVSDSADVLLKGKSNFVGKIEASGYTAPEPNGR